MIEVWEKLNTKEILKTKIFNLEEHVYINPRNTKENNFVIINSPNWVNILPITPDNKIILIKQFRAGINEVSIEIPGGLIEPDELPIDSAKRELKEETGGETNDWKLIGSVYPNPAFQNNLLYTFLAKNVELKFKPSLDEGEDIEVLTVDEDEVINLIINGQISHSLVINAFFWHMISKERNK